MSIVLRSHADLSSEAYKANLHAHAERARVQRLSVDSEPEVTS